MPTRHAAAPRAPAGSRGGSNRDRASPARTCPTPPARTPGRCVRWSTARDHVAGLPPSRDRLRAALTHQSCLAQCRSLPPRRRLLDSCPEGPPRVSDRPSGKMRASWPCRIHFSRRSASSVGHAHLWTKRAKRNMCAVASTTYSWTGQMSRVGPCTGQMSGDGPYNGGMARLMIAIAASAVISTVALGQTPQPFPRPGSPPQPPASPTQPASPVQIAPPNPPTGSDCRRGRTDRGNARRAAVSHWTVHRVVRRRTRTAVLHLRDDCTVRRAGYLLSDGVEGPWRPGV